MKSFVTPRDKITAAAARALCDAGLQGFTVGRVAAAAGVSTALVHYHFSTKQALLAAAAGQLATTWATGAAEAFGHGAGLETLDRLWETLQRRAESGEERACAELRLAGGADRALAVALEEPRAGVREAIARRLPALLRELGSAAPAEGEELAAAIAAVLDGAALARATGRPAGEVRAAYDAFWLVLIAAGQSGRRR